MMQRLTVRGCAEKVSGDSVYAFDSVWTVNDGLLVGGVEVSAADLATWTINWLDR